MDNIQLSCVATLYRSREFVVEFVERMAATAAQAVSNFEIILVDDGSPDDSRDVAISLLDRFPMVRVIELSRNFGHHLAILAGLTEAKGELVFLIDSDLEEAPELLQEFWGKIDDVDVVFGVHNREGKGPLDRLSGNLFWNILSAASKTKIPKNLANVRLMRRGYVDALLSMPDRNVFLGGMFAWPGFRQLGVRIERKERDSTSYSIGARLRLAVMAGVSFSNRPLLFVFGLGCVIATLSTLAGIFLIANKLIDSTSVISGYTSIMVSIWFLGGLIMGSIGLTGFYVAHIYEQSRERPRFIIRARYERK